MTNYPKPEILLSNNYVVLDFEVTNLENGSALNEYIVSPIFLPKTLGGNPKPNSSTQMPFFFATKKWPNS